MKNKIKHNAEEDKWKCMQNIISEIGSNKKEKCKKEEKVVFCFLLHSLAGCIYTICFICLVIYD